MHRSCLSILEILERLVLVWRGDDRVGLSVCMVGALLTILNLSNYASRSTVRIFMSKVKLTVHHATSGSTCQRSTFNVSTPASRSPCSPQQSFLSRRGWPGNATCHTFGPARFKGHRLHFSKHCVVAKHHTSDAPWTTPPSARRIRICTYIGPGGPEEDAAPHGGFAQTAAQRWQYPFLPKSSAARSIFLNQSSHRHTVKASVPLFS